MTTPGAFLWLSVHDTLETALALRDGGLADVAQFNTTITELREVHNLTIEELADIIREKHPQALKSIKKLWPDPNYQLTLLDKALIRMTLDGEKETN